MKSRNTLLIAILSALACFAFLPGGRADDPVTLSNTADWDLALGGLTTGIYNSAFGFYALLSNADANFNTGVGAGALLVNTASNNTTIGAAGLFSNTTGISNRYRVDVQCGRHRK
jgi:hypothetical protein